MRKWSVSSEGGETEEEAGQERSRKGGLARKQSAVTPEFQMSMLRASLEESKIISSGAEAGENKTRDETAGSSRALSLVQINRNTVL